MNLATNNSNYVILTSDDLHNEDFNKIVSDTINGIEKTNFEIIMNRGKAIEKGVSLLKDKDMLLILGKGHEEFIIMKDKKIPFNDRKYIELLLKKLGVLEKEVKLKQLYNTMQPEEKKSTRRR